MIKITDNPTLKKIAVILLAIAAVLAAIYSTNHLFYTCYEWGGIEISDYLVELYTEGGYGADIQEVTKFNKQGIIPFLIDIVPCLIIIVVLLYVLKLIKNKKAFIIIPIAYAIPAVWAILNDASIHYLSYSFDFHLLTNFDTWIWLCPILIAFILVILNLLVFKRSHWLMIIATSVGLLGALLRVWVEYFNTFRGASLFERLKYMNSIYLILFYVAMILCFIRKNAVSMAKKSPEKALITLNQQLADGLITEEEYQKARTNILMKL